MNTIRGHQLIQRLVEQSRRDWELHSDLTRRALMCIDAINPSRVYTYDLAVDLVKQLESEMESKKKLEDICE